LGSEAVLIVIVTAIKNLPIWKTKKGQLMPKIGGNNSIGKMKASLKS
jgi:hypothetical protein